MPLLNRRQSAKRRRRRDDHAPGPKRRPASRPRGGPPIIDIRDATVVYPGGHVALEHLSLDVHRGEFAFITGPTGCGKSTLIKMLIREIEPAAGSTSRISILIRVDLPQPVGPTTKANSPRWIEAETRSSATWPPG